MTDPYEDILSLPYPFLIRRKRMSLTERAAQFAPFAALSGFSEAITAADDTPPICSSNDGLSEECDSFVD